MFNDLLLTKASAKYLLALKCLLAAAALDKEHSRVHEDIVRFAIAIEKDAESISPEARDVIKSEFTLLPAGGDLKKFNEEYFSKNKDCARRTVSALKVRKILSPESASSVEKDIVNVLSLPSITFEEAKETYELLCSWKSSEAKAFRSKAAAKWPKATVFSTST